MNLSTLTGDDALLLRRLGDLSTSCENRHTPRFTAFLSEGERCICEAFTAQNSIKNMLLFGGYPGASRVMCGFFPDYTQPDEAEFPIEAVTLSYPRDKGLTHRDFLGTLMGLGLERNAVGDILPADGRCVLFLTTTASRLCIQELKKVGGTGVKIATGFSLSDIPAQEFKEISGTVSSPRLDSVVKLCVNLSREKSARLITGGLVQLNHNTAESVSVTVTTGDVMSVRGYGKFIVDEIGGLTKKGRLWIKIRKYL